jgi:hypothetical protein
LEDLKPRGRYVFRFAARNPVGTGDWAADLVHIMPDEGPPFVPEIENAPTAEADFIEVPNIDHYELRWQVPPANGMPIDKFEVTYYKVSIYYTTVADSPSNTEQRRTFD